MTYASMRDTRLDSPPAVDGRPHLVKRRPGMFRKFSPKEDVASSTKVKSSVQRTIRSKLAEQMPLLAKPGGPVPDAPAPAPAVDGDAARPDVPTILDVIWPKKEDLTQVKCREHVTVLVLGGQPLFFQHFDGPYYPTLHLLHKYPDLLPSVQVDRGAIKFVLSGANIMCPGLTSSGGQLPPAPGLPAEAVVAIRAQGKDHACAVGKLMMSTEDIRHKNKGHGVESVHILNDDLYTLCGPGGKGL